MTDALSALFTRHLPHLGPAQVTDYLAFNGLVEDGQSWAQVRWRSPQGGTWSLLDCAVEAALTQPATPTLPHLLHALLEQAVPADARKWHQCDEPTRAARARAYLATQRLAAAIPDSRALDPLQPWLATSFAGKPAGTPAAGFARPGDGGWLGYVFAEIDRALARPAPMQADWADVLSGWFAANLLARHAGTLRWWGVGKVAGTRVRRAYPGQPGWEAPGQLPLEPDASSAYAWPVRPSGLPAHFDHLAVQLLGRLATALSQPRAHNPSATLGLASPHPPQLASSVAQLGPWLTPAARDQLAAVAAAGLLTPSASAHAHHRFDGRALEALAILVQLDPAGPWASEQEKQALAQAVLDHQRAWEADPRPHVQALARQEFAPRAHAHAWEWASQAAPAPARTGPRP